MSVVDKDGALQVVRGSGGGSGGPCPPHQRTTPLSFTRAPTAQLVLHLVFAVTDQVRACV